MTQKTSLILALALAGAAFAQNGKLWSLGDCIAQAQKSSLQAQSATLDEKLAASNLEQARNARLPDLTGRVNQTLSDRPFVDAAQDHYALSVGLSSSMPVWNAGRIGNDIEQKSYLKQSSELQSRQTRQDIAQSVIEAYMQVWSLMESEGIAREALALAQTNLQRDSALFAAGSLTRSAWVLTEAEKASDSLTLLQASHTLVQARTKLRQLLELPVGTEISLAAPDTTFPATSIDDSQSQQMARNASATRQSDSLQVLAANAAIRKAEAGYYPDINLSASASTGLSAWESGAYGSQFKNGYTHSLTLGISIPIVDWGATRASVLQAQVAKEKVLLSSQSNDKSLENTIETLTLQAEASRLQWQTAKQQAVAQEAAWQVVNDKENLGMLDRATYLQQKNLYLNAQAKLNQAKFTYLRDRALLSLFTGESP